MDELYNALLTLNIPVAYRGFRTPQHCPYIIYYQDTSNNFAADNRVYQHIMGYSVELYTETKDPELEAQLEQALDSYVWRKSEDYIDSEKTFIISYDLEV